MDRSLPLFESSAENAEHTVINLIHKSQKYKLVHIKVSARGQLQLPRCISERITQSLSVKSNLTLNPLFCGGCKSSHFITNLSTDFAPISEFLSTETRENLNFCPLDPSSSKKVLWKICGALHPLNHTPVKLAWNAYSRQTPKYIKSCFWTISSTCMVLISSER